MPLDVRRKRLPPVATTEPTNKPTMDDGLIDEEELVEGSLQTLHRLGLRLPRKPKAKDGTELDPVFPSDLSEVSSDSLGRLLGEFTSMADYATAQLALMDTRQAITKYNEKLTVTWELLGASGGNAKLREAKATTQQKARVRALAHQVRVAEYTLLRTVAEGFTNKAKAISREITRRLNQQDREP